MLRFYLTHFCFYLLFRTSYRFLIQILIILLFETLFPFFKIWSRNYILLLGQIWLLKVWDSPTIQLLVLLRNILSTCVLIMNLVGSFNQIALNWLLLPSDYVLFLSTFVFLLGCSHVTREGIAVTALSNLLSEFWVPVSCSDLFNQATLVGFQESETRFHYRFLFKVNLTCRLTSCSYWRKTNFIWWDVYFLYAPGLLLNDLLLGLRLYK